MFAPNYDKKREGVKSYQEFQVKGFGELRQELLPATRNPGLGRAKGLTWAYGGISVERMTRSLWVRRPGRRLLHMSRLSEIKPQLSGN